MCVGEKMAFREFSRCSADMAGINDCVPVWTSAMSSICASSSIHSSSILHCVTYESIKGHHYGGCSNQLNVAQMRWEGKKDLQGGSQRHNTQLYNFFIYFFCRVTPPELKSAHWSASATHMSWAVKAMQKFDKVLWLCKACYWSKTTALARVLHHITTSQAWLLYMHSSTSLLYKHKDCTVYVHTS